MATPKRRAQHRDATEPRKRRKEIPKVATGIAGLDKVLGGGLPAGRMTLLTGGAGSGKSMMGLQCLLHGAGTGEPGILVMFEERASAVRQNALSLGWDLAPLEKKNMLFLMDACLCPAAVISGDFLNLMELRKAKRTLKDNNAKPVEDGKYVVLVHPDVLYDLEGDSNITNLWHYGGAGKNQEQIFDTTFKDLPLGFRVYESSIVPITRASGYGDVYNTFVLGAEAYGTVKLETMPAKIIVHLPGEAGVADPLDQVATVGWKANFAAAILNQNNMVLVLSQASTFTGTRAGL